MAGSELPLYAQANLTRCSTANFEKMTISLKIDFQDKLNYLNYLDKIFNFRMF